MTPDQRIKGPFVLYFRVSTKRQNNTGYGLDAQRRDVQLFLDHFADGEALDSFTDVESGKHDDPRRRPGLAAALAQCRKRNATLLVAKLDRLSRKVSHISALLDVSSVQIKVASMPFADKFSLHIYAALAEQEREFISLRTRQGLASARLRGRSLGGHRGGEEARTAAVKAIADTSAQRVADIVLPLRKANQTLQQIADALTKAGIETPRGKKVWHPATVKKALDRLEGMAA